MIRSRQGEFAKGAIASPLHALCDRLSGQMPQGTKVPQAALLHALKEAGWIDVGYIASGEYTTKKHVWVAPEFKRRSKSDLRRMVEPVTGDNVVELKKTAP
jgi:hypothetical protein